MADADGRTLTIERLQSLLNRLADDDLTLAEAALVRAQILGMLSDSSTARDAAAAADILPVDHGSSPFRLQGRSNMACSQALC